MERINGQFLSHYIIPPDAECIATRLVNKKWAVWTDEGQPPFQYKEFTKWTEAIKFLRNKFENRYYPEEYWGPEGFGLDDDIYSLEPNKNKQLED
ncbi:hypothetical protein V7087_03630 [Neobacillus niacini]|uniref:hypothetical protein n=1 Tax=Neobacillus niacini TaxID=86668 RepID=UPI002FFFE728